MVNKAVPADKLEEEVNQLAARIANIHPELLGCLKLAVNSAYEFMGIKAALQTSAMLDAIAHRTPAAQEFIRNIIEKGLKAALEERDRPFGDYSARKRK